MCGLWEVTPRLHCSLAVDSKRWKQGIVSWVRFRVVLFNTIENTQPASLGCPLLKYHIYFAYKLTSCFHSILGFARTRPAKACMVLPQKAVIEKLHQRQPWRSKQNISHLTENEHGLKIILNPTHGLTNGYIFCDETGANINWNANGAICIFQWNVYFIASAHSDFT